MRALVYQVNPVGYATCKWLRYLWEGCLTTGLNGLSMRTVDEPQLPADDWVRVRTLLGGICGTDVAIVNQKQPIDSILQAYSSQPMILGHENVAVVAAAGPGVDAEWIGKRVCVEPTLSCVVRGIDPPCDRCSVGEFGACENFGAAGVGSARLPAGTSIGYNSRTGGSFGEQFVAHVSQLVAVPDEISDEQALLTDPLACGLHAVLRTDLTGARHVLVYGAGMIGLSIIAGLRAMGFDGKIDAIDRCDYLASWAAKCGADEYLQLPAGRKERSAEIARRVGGELHLARFNNPMVSGGYDVVYDCVGAPSATTECLKWTRARGQMVLVATGAGRDVDMTPIWFRELTIIGAYGRQIERVAGRDVGTYQLVHEVMLAGKLDAEGMVTHTYRPGEYRKALHTAMHKSAHQAMKVALDFREQSEGNPPER